MGVAAAHEALTILLPKLFALAQLVRCCFLSVFREPEKEEAELTTK
jgi:hypothetical protein